MSLDFDSVFGPQQVELTCPGCGYKFKVKFSELSQDGSSIVCPGCDRSIKIEHDSSVAKAVSGVNNSFKELEETIKNFGK